MAEDILIPLAFFFTIVCVVALIVVFRYRMRKELQLTIRQIVVPGEHFSPELLQQLMEAMTPKASDLRRGAIWLAIGLATLALGFFMSGTDAEALYLLLGVSAFPFFIGLAYLLLWRLNDQE